MFNFNCRSDKNSGVQVIEELMIYFDKSILDMCNKIKNINYNEHIVFV